MNIFFREIKKYRKSLFFWCVGLVVLIASGMAKFSVYQDNSAALSDLMSQLPQSIQTVFGLSGFDLTTASGFYGVTFLYVALMVSVHAVLMGANIIAKEERDRTSEFLFVKPVSRFKILTSKILAGLFEVLAINAVTFISSIWVVDAFNDGPSINNDIATLMTGLLFMQLIFFFAGTAVAAISRRPKASASIATSILLVTFIAHYLVNMSPDLDWVKYFTPFKYFDAHNLISGVGIELVYVLLSTIIIGISVTATYYFYNKRDLSV
jgi:ABC-2 type transport system permease protein